MIILLSLLFCFLFNVTVASRQATLAGDKKTGIGKSCPLPNAKYPTARPPTVRNAAAADAVWPVRILAFF